MVSDYYFARMVTGMQFLQFFFYETQVEYLREAFTKGKKVLKTLFCCLITNNTFLRPKLLKINKKTGCLIKNRPWCLKLI